MYYVYIYCIHWFTLLHTITLMVMYILVIISMWVNIQWYCSWHSGRNLSKFETCTWDVFHLDERPLHKRYASHQNLLWAFQFVKAVLNVLKCCLWVLVESLLQLHELCMAYELFMLIMLIAWNQIHRLPVELLEMLLMRTATILTVSLFSFTRQPDIDAYMMLSAVCQSWYQTISSRSWFRKVLHHRLKSK